MPPRGMGKHRDYCCHCEEAAADEAISMSDVELHRSARNQGIASSAAASSQ